MAGKWKLEGAKEFKKALKRLDKRTQNRTLRKIHRQLLTPLKKELAANAPSTPHSTFKRTQNISVISDRYLGNAMKVGYKKSRDTFMARWLERGTVSRTTRAGAKRGRIVAQRWINRTHKMQAPIIVRRFNTEWEKMIIKAFKSEARSLTRKISKLI